MLRGLRDQSGVPGGKAALLALLFAVGVALTLPWQTVAVDEKGEILEQSEQDARAKAGEPELTERVISVAPAQVAIFATMPVALAGYGLWSVRRRRAFRSVVGIAGALVVLAVYAQLMLPTAIAFGVAVYQVRKAEQASRAPSLPDEDNDGDG